MAKKNKNKSAEIEVKAEPVKHRATNQLSTRSFAAAIKNRLNADWGSSQSLNVDLQQGLKALRGISRDLSLNNEITRRYLKMMKANVVGPDGILLSVQAVNYVPETDKVTGKQTGKYVTVMDSYNKVIEDHFYRWGSVDTCTVQGRFDWRKTQELVLESVARDGEALVRLCRGPEHGKYCFALQLMDAAHLDETFTSTAANGNPILQGVESNEWGRHVAYYIWEKNPEDTGVGGLTTTNRRIRIDAKDLIHVFDPERASQCRGYPWMASAINAIQHVSKYRESELVAARTAANKQVFYKQKSKDAAFVGDEDEADQIAADGTLSFESAPGTHEVLPPDWDVTFADFNNPNSNFAGFQKAVLQLAASGLNVSYNSLANDLQSVNYSSARFGSLEDQNQYKSLQSWFINAFVKPVYENWLSMQLLTDNWGLGIPMSRFDKFNTVRYIARRWSSVDVAKDLTAEVMMLNNCLTSYTDVITKLGRDPEEVFAQRQKDDARMKELGITPISVQQSIAELVAAQVAADTASNTESSDVAQA